MPKTFVCDCVSCGDGRAIQDMVDRSRQITRRTFLRHVDREEMRRIEGMLSYATGSERGLHMANDWAVSYHKSRFRGRPCVYFDWSAIEHIFQ